MKQLLFFLLAFYCTQLNAQTNVPLTIEDKKMDNYLMERKPAILTIQINNLPDSVKKVGIKYTLVQLGIGLQTTRYAETDQTGSAKVVLDQNFPYQQIWLNVGDFLYAGIYVNTALTVTLDVNKLPKDGAYMIDNGVLYSGADGDLNRVMNKNVLFKKEEREGIYNRLRNIGYLRRKITPESFSFTIDSIRKELTRLDTEFITGFKNYAWAIKNETLSEFYGNLCVSYSFDTMPTALFKEVSKHQPFFTSNDGALFYRYLNNYTQTMGSGGKTKTLNSALAAFDSLYTVQKSDVLKLMQLETEKDVFSESYASIIKGIQTMWIKKLAVNELNKANLNQQRIDNLFALSTKIENAIIGTPLAKMPFEAELYSLDKIKSADDFMLNLKRKFPNKAFIIDFWATWCSPCLRDLPFSKKLHEANKDLAVEYIYLCTSTGSKLEIWKNKVADLQIPGTHIFVEDAIIIQLKEMFNANGGYPAYVSIDINGKINPRIITEMRNLNRESLKKIAGL